MSKPESTSVTPRIAALTLAFIVVLTASADVAGQNVSNAARIIEADSMAAAFARENGLPALTVAVASQAEIVYSHAVGLADLENGVEADVQTVFRIASVTKPLTATAVMDLAEAGDLDLDLPIDTYCAGWTIDEAAPTARQLLAHLGGVPDYNRVERGVWKVATIGVTVHGSNPFHFTSVAEALAAVAPDSLISAPGESYRYSNVGYLLLGCALEGATGLDYDEVMQRRVFGPAGMSRTQPDDAYRIIANRARPYQGRSERTKDWWWWTPVQKEEMEVGVLYNARFEDTSIKLPAGGLLSTAEDLARFALAFNGGAIVDERSRAAMLTVQRTASGDSTSWGLGWSIAHTKGKLVAGMSGGQPGASAVLRTVPAAGFAVAAITNRDLVSLDPLVVSLGRLWGVDL